jgi:hypothetical protein
LEPDEQGQSGRSPNATTGPLRHGSAGRRLRDDGQIRVARFLSTGGVDLVGRVINADTGKPAPGVSVEARLEGRFVALETQRDGTFIMPGMVPGSKVVVWLGGRQDQIVAERFDVRIADNAKTSDMGTVRLLEGDESDPRLDGWIGLHIARAEGRVRVSAVNAWVPASSAGIEVGDTVLSVNGRDIKGLGPRSIAFLLRGPNDSSVTLELESLDGTRRQLKLKRVLH